MKKWIHVLAVVAIAGAAILGMTSTATEEDAVDTSEIVLIKSLEKSKDASEKEDVILVDFDYIEEFEPQTLYALEGAELFQGAGYDRKLGNIEAGTPIFCYQKTTNGFFYGSSSQQGGFYIAIDAVSERPDSKQKAPRLALSEQNFYDSEGILFVFSSYGEIDSITITNQQTKQQIILRGMGIYDYESYDFVTKDTGRIHVKKVYREGEVIEQIFDVSGAMEMVGIYDDGSQNESWLEMDGVFIEKEYN